MTAPHEYSPLPPWPRTDYCGALRAGDAGREVALWGWVASRRDHGGLIFIDLRDREGILQLVFNPAEAPAAHEIAGRARSEYYLAARGKVVMRSEGTVNAELPTGDGRSRGDRGAHPQHLAAAAVSDRRRGHRRRRPPALSLYGSAPPGDAAQSAPARAAVQATRSFLDNRLRRNRNADPVARHARRRARLPGAQPRQPGKLLRAAAIAAAFEAAPDGIRLRPLLSDCAMLPRRGPARQPPARVQPDRHRDDLPAARRHDGDRRGHDGGDLPPRARGRVAAAVSAPDVRRSDGTFRHRQARHALRAGAEGFERRVCRHAVQGFRRSARARREHLRNRVARGVSVEPPRAGRDDRGLTLSLRAWPGLGQDRE